MKKITMMTALMAACLCVGVAMAEPEQKKPERKAPRVDRREGAEKRPERPANRFGGKVVAKDGATVTVKNRSEKEMKFTAKTAEAKKMLEGVAVNDFVGVRFTKTDDGVTLDSIRKFEPGARPPRPEGAPGERRVRKGDGAKDKPAAAAAKAKAKVEGEKKGDCCEGCPKEKAKEKGKEKAKDKPKAK